MSDAVYLLQGFSTGELVEKFRKWKKGRNLSLNQTSTEWLSFLESECLSLEDAESTLFWATLAEELGNRGLERF